MLWLLKFGLIWLSLDVLIIATSFYLAKTIKPNFPNWWRNVIADEPSLDEVALSDEAPALYSGKGGELWNIR